VSSFGLFTRVLSSRNRLQNVYDGGVSPAMRRSFSTDMTAMYDLCIWSNGKRQDARE
jgi:hypothetical protein